MQVKIFLSLTVFKYIKDLLIKLIVSMYIAFIIIKNLTFKGLLNMLLFTLSTWFLYNSHIFGSWIIQIYHNQNVLLSKDMHLVQSSIYLSFYLTTSDNSLTFVVVMAHVISQND